MLDMAAIDAYVQEFVVNPFYQTRVLRTKTLTLDALILKKNPYLFRAKNITLPWNYVQSAFDAFLSSQEETVFGNLMEGLAIFICGAVYGGQKAPTKEYPSVDLIFGKNGKNYIVGIKSGPNWGNSDQINRMKTNFKAARQKLLGVGMRPPIIAVNGCMYGRDNVPEKVDVNDPEKSYLKLCGQVFWEFVSGDSDLYANLIEPLEKQAKIRGPQFEDLYSRKLTQMSTDFTNRFVKDGVIDWDMLIKYVSENHSPTMKTQSFLE